MRLCSFHDFVPNKLNEYLKIMEIKSFALGKFVVGKFCCKEISPYGNFVVLPNYLFEARKRFLNTSFLEILFTLLKRSNKKEMSRNFNINEIRFCIKFYSLLYVISLNLRKLVNVCSMTTNVKLRKYRCIRMMETLYEKNQSY